MDIILHELYGFTECSGPATANMGQEKCRPGSVGQNYIGVNNRILNPDSNGIGEIATKSRNVFMGYHKNEIKTKEVFVNGWFKSGDLGRIDQDGFMWVMGRLKEIIITAAGENIAPVPIENQIKAELPDLLSNVVVIGDKRKYLTCLVTLKCKIDEFGIPTDLLDDRAIKFCQNICGMDLIRTIEEFKSNPKAIDAIEQAIQKANKKATANPHKVQKFSILPIDLTIAGGELGPTLKLKRHFIVQKYFNLIEEMYNF